MGLFTGIEKAEISERGKYLLPGFIGKLKIKRTLAKNSIKTGLAFIVECEVVETNGLRDDDGKELYPIGSSVTWYQKMQDRTVAFPAIKAFVAAASGVHPGDSAGMAEINAEMENILNEATENEANNALVGQIVKLETVATKTKKGYDFTRHNWSPVG